MLSRTFKKNSLISMLSSIDYCSGLAKGIRVIMNTKIKKKALLMLGVNASRANMKTKRNLKAVVNGLIDVIMSFLSSKQLETRKKAIILTKMIFHWVPKQSRRIGIVFLASKIPYEFRKMLMQVKMNAITMERSNPMLK